MSDPSQALLAAIRDRRSVRRFAPGRLPTGALEQVLEAARWAPSAGNRQAWRMWVVTGLNTIAAMRAAVEQQVVALRAGLRAEIRKDAGTYLDHFTFFGLAPVVVVPLYRAGPDLLAASQEQAISSPDRAEADALCSVAAAVQNLLLAAHSLGLGACWMTGPLVAADALADLLQVPAGWKIAALVPIGRPAEDPPPPARRAPDRLVRILE
jgi:nitroreductase